MKVYLACPNFHSIEDLLDGADILVAYPYAMTIKNMSNILPRLRNFILDSGVFTMINSGKRFKLDDYVEQYGNYVREHNIKNYVEMDVDQIIGVDKTRRLRERLENIVGWQSIPVWHTIRGKQSFIQDCKDYNYIALGYFMTEGLKATVTEKYARGFIDLAHKYNCKIHGLGFTKTKTLEQFPFDSVDSSSWRTGVRYCQITTFNLSKRCIETTAKKSGMRAKNSQSLCRPSFIEWRKFQDYAYFNICPIWQ